MPAMASHLIVPALPLFNERIPSARYRPVVPRHIPLRHRAACKRTACAASDASTNLTTPRVCLHARSSKKPPCLRGGSITVTLRPSRAEAPAGCHWLSEPSAFTISEESTGERSQCVAG